MTEQEAIEDLKHENEQCLSLCEAACASIKEYQCNCRDSVIERMIDELLQYRKIGTVEECRKAVELQPDFMESMFGCSAQLSAGSQKDAFHTLIADVLGEGAGYAEVAEIHEHLEELAAEAQESPDPVLLSQEDVRRLLEECGVSEEKMEAFDRMYAAAVGTGSLTLQNIACGRRLRIETPDVKIEVAPDRLDLVEARFIDGKECLVVTVNDRVEVDGMNVRTIGAGGFENEENV